VAQIDDALNTLGPKVKRAFLLAQFEGMGYAAIARQLGVTPRTIVNYVARAMAQCCLHAP
jgi:RNA polymerase sigma-70 factor (ECF subfamily)